MATLPITDIYKRSPYCMLFTVAYNRESRRLGALLDNDFITLKLDDTEMIPHFAQIGLVDVTEKIHLSQNILLVIPNLITKVMHSRPTPLEDFELRLVYLSILLPKLLRSQLLRPELLPYPIHLSFLVHLRAALLLQLIH